MATHLNCNGMLRRDFIQLGLRGIAGYGLCDLLRLKAQAATPASGKPINCIMIWLDGGPSHFETFDPKPEAPAEIRGVFKTVPTKVPGVHCNSDSHAGSVDSPPGLGLTKRRGTLGNGNLQTR